MKMYSIEQLEKKRFELRENVLNMVYTAKTGHIGGDMSSIDMLAVLYLNCMNVSPERMDDPERDYFILSKGHSVEAYYAVLHEAGFLTDDEIKSFTRFGSSLTGHPNNKLNGIEMNSGSLGHGLPVAVGIALANKMDRRKNRTYVVMGDGELAEGSVWEAAMSASNFGLDRLCLLIDRNGLQISGMTESVMKQENLHARWAAFGWDVIELADGNDPACIADALRKAESEKSAPSVIIAHTVKGCGIPFMEGKAQWHHKVPNEEEYKAALKCLHEQMERA